LIFGSYRGQGVVGDPVADGLVVEIEGEVGFAAPVVEVLDGDAVNACGLVEFGGEGAGGGLVADDGLAVGGGLPGFDVDGSVAFGGHVFGFDAVGVVADTALLVGGGGFFLEPLCDGVAPDDGVAGLVGEESKGLVVALVVDEAGHKSAPWLRLRSGRRRHAGLRFCRHG
jgi:hypothetical protein